MTVTGACMILALLLPETHSTSRALASSLVTKTKRAGVVLAAVGPILARS